MWYRKRDRILDLEARLEVALRNQPETPEQAPAPRRSAGDANRIHTLTVQRDAAVLQVADERARTDRYARLAVSRDRRLRRALRACARYRADAAQQRAASVRLTDQLFDSMGYSDDLRARLNSDALTREAAS